MTAANPAEELRERAAVIEQRGIDHFAGMEESGPVTEGLRYDLSNDEYHAQTDWLSSSMLKTLLPEEYKQGGSQEALDFGTLFHTVVLEPERVALDYVALDAAKIGLKKDGTVADHPTNTIAWKTAVSQARADGLIVVDQVDLDRAFAMRDAAYEHEDARGLLFSANGRSEVSAFATDENGIRHKARFDRLVPGEAVDLKSTAAKPGAHSLTRTVIDYGYELSAAHYLAVAELAGVDVQRGFSFVFVGKEAPYRVSVCDLDDLLLERGRNLRSLALERAAKKTDPYEGAVGRFTLFCPAWALPYDDEMVVA